jgi:stage III sporulation protein AH
MNKFKKNQIVVYAIALMLVVAGYLNYIENDRTVEISTQNQNTNIGDATLVSNNEVEENENNSKNSDVENSKESEDIQETDISQDENVEKESYIETNFQAEDEYFANSRIEREKMYSQMLETYQKMLENTSISEEQKSIATQEIKKINDTKNAIMICENLISIKGFSNSVVLSNGESINVVLETKELSEENIAQIQNIITREMNTEIENIHIMKK